MNRTVTIKDITDLNTLKGHATLNLFLEKDTETYIIFAITRIIRHMHI